MAARKIKKTGQVGTSRSQSKSKPLCLGLTGSLASGKSTTLKIFHKLGFKICSADDIVAEIYNEKKLTKDALIKKYNTPAKLKTLEAWVHPLVRKRIEAWVLRQRRPMIVEIPLLFETHYEKYFDRVIFVYAPKADRLQRVINRGMSPKLFRMLDKKQWSPKKKAAHSDFVLKNTTKKSLKNQIRKLVRQLSGSKN